MTDKAAEPVDISIDFTEQQMDLVQQVAADMAKSPAEAVAAALQAFIQKQGHRYTR